MPPERLSAERRKAEHEMSAAAVRAGLHRQDVAAGRASEPPCKRQPEPRPAGAAGTWREYVVQFVWVDAVAVVQHMDQHVPVRVLHPHGDDASGVADPVRQERLKRLLDEL